MPSRKTIPPSSAPAAPLSVRQETPLTSDNWDALISSQPAASLFHHTAWAKVLSQTYGFTPVYLSASCDQKPVAAMPVMEIESWLTGKRGVSLPFTDECEPLGFPAVFSSSLVQEALRVGRVRGWKYLEWRGGKNPFNDASPSITFHGHKLKLSTATDLLFSRFESSVRRAIRKSEKSGVQVEFSHSLQAVSEFYALHCHTRKEHGLPPQPFGFFRRLHEHLVAKNLGVVVTAKLQDQPLASAIYFYHGRAAIYKFGASIPAALDLRANNLVMWEAIKWLAAQGAEELTFGRTSTRNEGLRRYKLGWGTEEYAINYYRYDLRRDLLISMNDEAVGWHNTLFRTLPASLGRYAGQLLYKHIA